MSKQAGFCNQNRNKFMPLKSGCKIPSTAGQEMFALDFPEKEHSLELFFGYFLLVQAKRK